MKDKDSIKWLYKISRKQIPNIILLSINNVLLAVIGIAVALLSKKIIDAAVKVASTPEGLERDYTNIIFFGVIMFAAITVRVLLRIGTQSLSVKIQARLEMGMRSKFFRFILSKNYEEINAYHSGELMNRITSDINIISNGVTSLIPDVAYLVAQFVGALSVLIIFDWKFALIFVVGGLLVFLVANTFRGKLKQLHKEVQSTDGKARSFFQETIESLLVVKTFGVEDELQQKGLSLQKDNYDAKMKRRRVSIYANSGFGFVFNIGYLYALIWCSIKLCQNSMTYGTLTAILQLIGQVQTPFVNITRAFPQFYGVLASAERVMEVEALRREEKTETSFNIEQFYNDLENIEFKDVHFNYGRESVLTGGDVVINKGDFVAIRGISGIGKSTLMKMLLGVFKPKSGEIRLNKNDGTYAKASVDTRGLFSYVPQGNYLFSGTLRQNLLLINEKATEEEIKKALKVSDIDKFISELPQGLDTVIGEKGLGLSEGQVQRIAIARAVISKSPILLLDEATSALDAQTEKNVLNNIMKLKNRTCIIITHKKAALEVCNKELVIENKILRYKA